MIESDEQESESSGSGSGSGSSSTSNFCIFKMDSDSYYTSDFSLSDDEEEEEEGEGDLGLELNSESEPDSNPEGGMIIPSAEQSNVIVGYNNGYNMIIPSVAGAGKSTVVLMMARSDPNKFIIQLTYNAQLKAEIREKVKHCNLQNVEPHTYHSLATKYYDPLAHDDVTLNRIVKSNTPRRCPLEHNHLHAIIIDESQDATPLYYAFVYKFLVDCREYIDEKEGVQIIVLGDEKQSIYGFKGADSRFLTMAESVWGHHPCIACRGIFYEYQLTTSYRVTENIAWFINDVMMGKPFMQSSKEGPRIIYIRDTHYNAKNYVYFQIKKMIQSGDIMPEDVFVLGNTLRQEYSFIRQLENMFVEDAGFPCFMPGMDTADLNQAVIRGKIVFSSFHQSKGREKQVVIVTGFDNNHFKYFDRDNPNPKECPNIMYVAVSRAKKMVILVENSEDTRPLPFLKIEHKQLQTTHHEQVDFRGKPFINIYENVEDLDNIQIQLLTPPPPTQQQITSSKFTNNVTDMYRFLNEDFVQQISDWIEHENIFSTTTMTTNSPVDIPSTVKTSSDHEEEISDLNGKIIPLLYEFKYTQKCTIKSNIDHFFRDPHNARRHKFLLNAAKEIVYPCNTVGDFLYMLNVYQAIQDGLYFRVKQIGKSDYNWLTQTMIDQCHLHLDAALLDSTNDSTDSSFEEGQEEEEEEETQDSTCLSVFEKDMGIKKFEHTILSSGDSDDIYYFMDRFIKDKIPEIKKPIRMSGRVDLFDVTNNIVWEFKCVKEITLDHLLQLIMYAWIWKYTIPRHLLGNCNYTDPLPVEEMPTFRILNIRTGEIKQLNLQSPFIDDIVVLIIKNKYVKLPEKTDDEFINLCYNLTLPFRSIDRSKISL